jgi:hypothetical protein
MTEAPADSTIYNAETGEWEPISPEQQWTVTEPDQTEEAKQADAEAQAGITPNCREIGKRHRYKDRQTGETFDYCLRCGEAKADATAAEKPASAATTPRAPRTSTKRTQTLDMILGGLWYGAGALTKNLGTGSERGAPLVVAGKVMQLEAGIAGPKLHAALKRTPLYPYIAVAQSQVGWLADLAVILAPPLLLGAAAANPKVAQGFKPILVGVLTPMLAEVAKAAAQQSALLSALEGYDEDTINAAASIVDDLLGVEEEDTKPEGESE